eukprot:SM000133S26824  [mRNA]  locus=s133:383881:385324:+ [translate_table: standard]
MFLAARGSCSSDTLTIPVGSANDFIRRRNYPNTQTVVLSLTNNITFNTMATLNVNHSCTIVQSAAGHRFRISGLRDDQPVLYLKGVHDFLFMGVDVHSPVTNSSTSNCTFKVIGNVDDTYCPALVIYQSDNVQIVQSVIQGGLQLFYSTNSLIDSNNITSMDWAIILGGPGNSVRPDFTLDKNVITNNYLHGYVVGINIAYGAVGNIVSNNYIDNFIFGGIVVGRGAHNTGDAMSNVFNYNYIVAHDDFVGVIPDAAGIYFVTHWINPNNTLLCNYVVGHIPHCLYLDFASSGINVDGMVCIGNGNGLKMNTGHSNIVTSHLIIASYAQPGYLSPQLNWNCGSDPGSYWDQTRRQYYNTPAFQTVSVDRAQQF